MIIGILRVTHLQALPFAREKIRAILRVCGMHAVRAAQIAGMLSNDMRQNIPFEITIHLDPKTGNLTFNPPGLCKALHQLHIPDGLSEASLKDIRSIMVRQSREELLHNLEHQVEIRTQELQTEREKSDRLLKAMLPASVANRLKNHETVADTHMASVVFIDIVGFTLWAAQLQASQLVEHLEHIFGLFDDICAQHGLEKIKTIGDCYMTASGIPDPCPDHADRAILACLDILQSMDMVRRELKTNLQVRIGAHCGPLVAGVIGKVKPFYDIWGDTVNIASRMESHGQPGKIHISDDMRQALQQGYTLHARGTIDIKNRGQINTWFIDRKNTEPH